MSSWFSEGEKCRLCCAATSVPGRQDENWTRRERGRLFVSRDTQRETAPFPREPIPLFFSFCMDACFPWSVVSLQVLCLPRLLYGFSISVDVIAEHWWYCVRTIIVVSLNSVHVWMSTFPNFVSRVSLDPFAFLDFSISWLAPSISLSTKRVFWPFYLFVDIFSLTNDKTYRAYDK